MGNHSLRPFPKSSIMSALSTAKKAGTTKKAAPKAAPVKKNKSAGPTGTRAGGVGYRKFEGRGLWLPNADVPAWLDGSLPGDRGFDPLGLAKPVEYLQVDVDSLDQNLDNNVAGGVVGSFTPVVDQVSEDRLQPYSEVFGLARMRECELIHGRWAMLATLGIIVAETSTGVSWVDAGKIELEGSQYLNFNIPINISQLCYIEALAMGGAEVYRNSSKNKYRRLYPGGFFDFANLASYGVTSEKQIIRLRESEIKHCRLAMIAFLGLS